MRLPVLAVLAFAFSACVADEQSGVRPDGGAADADADMGRDAGPVPTPGSCVYERPCGGQIAGSWRYQSACVIGEDGYFDDVCPRSQYEIVVDTFGSLTFGLDGTYVNDVLATTRSVFFVPAACFADEPVTAAGCDDIGRGLALRSSCQLDGRAGCVCSFADDPRRLRSSGSYLASGGQLLLDEQEMDYCVRGDSLFIRAPHDPEDGTLVIYELRAQAPVLGDGFSQAR